MSGRVRRFSVQSRFHHSDRGMSGFRGSVVMGMFLAGVSLLTACPSDDTSEHQEPGQDASVQDGGQEPRCVESAGGTTEGFAIDTQQGVFEARFEVTPGAGQVDAVLGLSQGMPDDQEWSRVAVTVMFSRDDTILGYDGDTYRADDEMSYEPDQTYQMRVVVDVPNQHYEFYVTPPGGGEQRVASNFVCRGGAGNWTSLDHVVVMSGGGPLRACLVSVTPVDVALAITTESLPPAHVGSDYHVALEAAGGTSPYTWSISSGVLPAGLSLDASTGVISGRPTEKGEADLTVQVADDAGATATRAFTLSVDDEQDNPYLEPVTIPACDESDPEVQIIDSLEDFSHINDADKRIFCVKPGDYTGSGRITITASGTETARRYIVLDNGNDIHPGKLDDDQRVKVAFEFVDASYWVLDRMGSYDDDNLQHIVLKQSTHNIFNRMYFRNVFQAIWIRNLSHYNTIQNSRFDTMTLNGAASDLAMINVAQWYYKNRNSQGVCEEEGLKHFDVFGTKVINNEFVNTKAFRLNRFWTANYQDDDDCGVGQIARFNGTIVDSNTAEFNEDVRTDCQGNPSPTGECMALEASFGGIKSGSDDPSQPVIYSNNKIWGGLPADRTLENLSSAGGGIGAYMGAKYIHFIHNVIFDTTGALSVADRYDMERGTWNAVIQYNIILRCGARPRARGRFPISISMAENADVEYNLIKDPIGTWGRVSFNQYGNYVGHNDVVNAESNELAYEGNWEPVAGIKPVDENNYYTTEESPYTEDFVFVTDRFTNHPRTITLENVVKP